MGRISDTILLAQSEEYRHMPALTPPSGVIPDFAVKNERAELFKVLCSILLAIVCIFLCLRLYAKVWIKRSQGFDDLACVLAVIGLSACFAFGVAMEQHGVGKHQWNVPISEIPFVLKFGKYNTIILPPTMLCLKLSLLLLYLRIFAPNNITRYLIYLGMAACVVAYTVLLFLNIFAPIDTVITANRSLGAVNFTSDVYILCIPIPAVSKLQLSMKKKIGVMVVFMAGLIACALSAVGLAFRCQVHPTEADATYLLANTILVTTIEEEIGLMCTCMPFFPAIVNNSPAFKKFIHSVASSGSIWTFRLGRQVSTTDERRNYQKHLSPDGSIEDGLELHGREPFTVVALPDSPKTLPDSPKKTPRTESVAFQGGERPKSSSASL